MRQILPRSPRTTPAILRQGAVQPTPSSPYTPHALAFPLRCEAYMATLPDFPQVPGGGASQASLAQSLNIWMNGLAESRRGASTVPPEIICCPRNGVFLDMPSFTIWPQNRDLSAILLQFYS